MAVPVDIVNAARAGDLEAFGVLVRRTAGLAVGVALARTGRPEIADEVAQDAFVDAWRLLPTLREPAAFAAWLRTVVVKHADRHTRRHREDGVLDESVVRADADPEGDTAAREEVRRVRAAVAALPAHQREAVALFHLSGCSHAEVAALLEVPVSTVKKRLHDARRRLEPLLEVPMESTVPAAVEAFVAARAGRTDLLARALDARPSLVAAVARPDAADVATTYAPPGPGTTLLHEAVVHGRADAARLLLDRGAAVDARTPGGLTALLAALVFDHAHLVPLLLERGADPRAVLRNGATAAHVAVHRGRPEVAHALIAAGADPAGIAEWSAFPGVVRPGVPGRVIDPGGRPLDDGPPVVIPARLQGTPDPRVRETGVKCVDLLAPFARSGVHRLAAGAGVGKIVLIGEIARSFGPTVVAGLLDRTWDVRDFEAVLRELGAWTDAAVVLGASADDHGALARSALALAEGRGGWLVADDRLEDALRALSPRVPVLVFGPHVHPETPPVRGLAVAQIVLDPARAARGEWPAFDPLHSGSSAAVDGRHARIAGEVRRAIGLGGPRAGRLLAWLTQPFRVAEEWNGRPGVVVPLATTLDEAEALVA